MKWRIFLACQEFWRTHSPNYWLLTPIYPGYTGNCWMVHFSFSYTPYLCIEKPIAMAAKLLWGGHKLMPFGRCVPLLVHAHSCSHNYSVQIDCGVIHRTMDELPSRECELYRWVFASSVVPLSYRMLIFPWINFSATRRSCTLLFDLKLTKQASSLSFFSLYSLIELWYSAYLPNPNNLRYHVIGWSGLMKAFQNRMSIWGGNWVTMLSTDFTRVRVGHSKSKPLATAQVVRPWNGRTSSICFQTGTVTIWSREALIDEAVEASLTSRWAACR